ncbi:D-alanyl-D-alanine carboxypeptidase (fragment) [Frankia canadensis]|uniref:D-alanyl-D-alanine carboxypeptidase n=1 Tax=Frankia canadensis TaxID=1836972 RepID=A0A2I2KWW6_9ACTN
MRPRRLAAGIAAICALVACALVIPATTAAAAPTPNPRAPGGLAGEGQTPLPDMPGPTTGGSVDLRAVACPSGGSIVVSVSIAADLARLLAAERPTGVALCGQGYRDIGVQIALRRQNCGPSDDQVWREPAAACSPPTAIPGTSRHELGLAVDFSSPTPLAYFWLATNAPRFGLHPLVDGSEPWHFSVDGH